MSVIEMPKEVPFVRPGDDWEKPLPILSSLPQVEPLTPEMLPTRLCGYVFDVAERQQSVPDFVAVAALVGIAALIGNKVRVAPKQHDDWEVVPNLYGAIIGPPSAMKSPTMKSALGPLYGLESAMRKDWESEVAAAGADDVLNNLDAKDAKKRAEKALKEGDREAARAILADLKRGGDEDQPCPRIIVNDATVEKLGELLNENPRGLLLVRDELPGFLSRMESEEYANDRAFYLECFNGDGGFVYDRIGRGTVHIDHCTLSLIGGVQPAKIAPIVRGAIVGTTDDGFIQRLQMAVWPDPRPSWRWIDRRPSRVDREAFESVFHEMHDLDVGSPEEPQVFRFDAAAQRCFQQWMEEVHIEARSGKLSPALESHILKMPKTISSLALIFELIEGGRQDIGRSATVRALAWAEYLRSHANRLYASANTVIENGARLLIERRSQLPDEFTLRDIYKKDWAGLADRDAAEMAVELLINTHHCREVSKPVGSAGGRPTSSYRWNPMVEA